MSYLTTHGGNRGGAARDLITLMTCEQFREAMSAALDGERAGIGMSELEAHLAGCAACREWRERAHRLTRRARISVATEPPPMPGALLPTLAEFGAGPRWWRSIRVLRAGLVLVAALQAAVIIRELVVGSDRDAPTHVAHEMGSFGMALAVGFLIAAWRPARARGMRALVGAAAILLVATAALDLVRGATTVSDEAPHLIAIAGWLLLCALAAVVPSNGDDRAGVAAAIGSDQLGSMSERAASGR